MFEDFATAVKWFLLAVAASAILIGLGFGIVIAKSHAQERPAFTADHELLCRSLDSRETQERLIAHWEATLDQAGLDALQAVILPPPDAAEKRAALERARRELQRAGLNATDAAVVEVEAELSRVPVAAEPARER